MAQRIDEETKIELQNPGTLQKVMDEFLSFAGQSDGLPGEVEEAEAQVAIARSRLDQSKQTGGSNPGHYGSISVDPLQAQAMLLAIRTIGTQQDVSALQPDITRLKMVQEGLSGRGSEPTAKAAQGFEIQNQGVTRRRPGEGPSVNGGRAQSQEMDSFDQPQYAAEAYDWKRDHDSFETQERVAEDKGADIEYDEHGKSIKKLGIDAKSSHILAKTIAKDHRKEDPNYYRNESRRIDEAMENLEEKLFAKWLKRGGK
jgi:hypothetical protein